MENTKKELQKVKQEKETSKQEIEILRNLNKILNASSFRQRKINQKVNNYNYKRKIKCSTNETTSHRTPSRKQKHG